MARLRSTIASKLADATVVNTIKVGKNFTTLNQKLASNISNIVKSDPCTLIIKDILNQIKESSVNGNYIYEKSAIPKSMKTKILNYFKKKGYGVAYYEKGSSVNAKFYWGPSKKAEKQLKGDKYTILESLKNAEKDPSIIIDDYTLISLKKNFWLAYMNGRKISLTSKIQWKTL